MRALAIQTGRSVSLLGSALWNWRSVLQFVAERRRGDYLSVRAGSLTDAEYGLLRELVEKAATYPGPIVEIGTLFGATTTRLAAWTSPEKPIITVDNYSWSRWGVTPEAQFDLAGLVLLHGIARGQIVQCRADKNAWFSEYRGEAPALVFCDAIHTYEETRADIEWARSVRAGIIAGHDYGAAFPGVVQAVTEAGGPTRLVDTLWTLPS